jgi:two-component system, OmpR family, sensor histidine kinase QseC
MPPEDNEPASMQRRLTLLLLGVLGLAWLACGVVTYFYSSWETNQLFDAQLEQTASLLVNTAAHEAEESVEMPAHRDYGHPYRDRVAYQVWDKHGMLLLRSANAPIHYMSEQKEGFSDSRIEATPWRVVARWDATRTFLVQAGELQEVRDDIIHGVVLSLLLPLVVLLPILGWLIRWAVRKGLAPLRTLAAEVDGRAPENLNALGAGPLPTELQPLHKALNHLFRSLGEALVHERRFTADASHELRTPLAALKTHAQVALAATDPATIERSLRQLIQGADRATRLVEQLLTLARLEPMRHGTALESVALRSELVECLATIGPSALRKNIELHLEEGPPVWVTGHPELLHSLMRNLVENAVSYTLPGGNVGVSLVLDGEAVIFSVVDDGPGISPDLRERVLQPFFRILGSSQSGSGLGLAIVKRVTDIYGASLHLGEGEGARGLRVTLRFKAAALPQANYAATPAAALPAQA